MRKSDIEALPLPTPRHSSETQMLALPTCTPSCDVCHDTDLPTRAPQQTKHEACKEGGPECLSLLATCTSATAALIMHRLRQPV